MSWLHQFAERIACAISDANAHINCKLEKIMSKLDELNTALDDLATRQGSIGEAVGGLASSITDELAAISAAIAALQGGGNVTDEQLQAVIDRVSALSTTASTQSGAIIDSTNQIKAETAALAPPAP